MPIAYWFPDSANHVIRTVDASGIINTLSLSSTDAVYIANGGLVAPWGMAVDSSGNLYVVDQSGPVIYKINTSGVVTRIAGSGSSTYSGDNGPALSAGMVSPYYIALDAAGNVYFSDTDSVHHHSEVVRAVNTQATTQTLLGVSIAPGNIAVVAGIAGSPGHSGMGGPAIAAQLEAPFGVAIDSQGNLYICDQGSTLDGGWILKVTTTGTINVFAGTGTRGFSGDAGPVGLAELNLPIGVCLDIAENVYITDTFNQRIRAVNQQLTSQTLFGVTIAPGNIQTVAGNGSIGYSGDGSPATAATVHSPWASRISPTGELYIADNLNFVIRKVATNGIISTVVGNHTAGYSGDGGLATAAEIQDPFETAAFIPVLPPSTGNILVSKSTEPPGSAQVFSFTPSYGAPFTLTDGQSNLSGALAPGTYAVAETPVAGWTTTTSSNPAAIPVVAGQTTNIAFTNISNCVAPPTNCSLVYIKSFPLTSGQNYTVALDLCGRLWVENVNSQPFVFHTLFNGIIPGSRMLSTTEDDVEYMCFSNYLYGTDIPRQYNPQPAIGGFTLDRISQVGPGAPPNFVPTTTASAQQATITSWAVAGGIVTFQAVNTFTAGEVITLSGFSVSTFFNSLQFAVLGTGLSGTQFEVAYNGSSGPSDSGIATPQFGYPIKVISQYVQQPFNGQIALWSAGPGQTSTGSTITLYYGFRNSAADQNLVNAFNSGQAVYVYIQNSPFGNGTQLVTGIGAGAPPGESPTVNYFTIQAPSASFQKIGSPGGGGNTGSYQQTLATVVVTQGIPNVGAGDSITISGSSPSGWNNTWTITTALNAGVYNITNTVMTNGNATYTYSWAGTGPVVNPSVGQLVTVLQTFNGNGIFNVTDAVIASVNVGAQTFTVNNVGAQNQSVPTESEQGQAATAGTSFQFDPGAITLGTTTNPIYGSASTGVVTVAGSNTAIAPGTRQAVVFFETRNGLKTACSAPITFTTGVAATYLFADNIPIGPADVIRRWIAFTTAGANGIPGPNFYTIDEPVTFTVNNQTFLYTPTYIDDNVSTSAKFTFTDAVLLAGDPIDVLGNNLFAQIELGSSAWNIVYAQRMFYGLEQNKVLNFTNLSFDGGYLPNPGSSIIPLGWALDLASNVATPTQATITSFQIIGGSPENGIVVFSAANNFVAGMQFVPSGLSVGTYLNGVTLTVLLATPTTITASFPHALTTPTADSGLLTPIIQTGGSLIQSSVFGNAYYINNQTSALQPQYGMIVQGAHTDAYQVPIILPNTLYSVRVTAWCPSGNTTGNLIVDLTGSNIGLASGSVYNNTYGITYGTFSIPFSSMSTKQQIFTGTLLTTPFLTGVPVGLLLRLWAQNIGVGNDVAVDRIEVFPTAQPTLTTNVRVSYVDNFEAFDANTGNLGLASHNTQPCFGAFEMYDQLYFLQSGSMQSTQDVPGIEPSNPGGGWALHEVSNRVGTCGIHAYDYGEEWMLTACRNGLYGFNGGQPIRLDFQQRELWELINWAFGYTIWVRNDLPNSRILVGVPLPTPNRWLPLAPSNPNPTSPNVVLMWNYQNLDTFEEIVSGRGVHTTMFGTLAAVDMRLKMAPWQITSPYAGFITQPDLTTQTLTICNGVGNQKVYQLSSSQLSDDGSPINSLYTTWGFMNAAKAKENPLLGLHRKRYQISQQLVTGTGVLKVQAFPNYLLAPTAPFTFNKYAYTVPGGIALQVNPVDDIIRPLNIPGNRVFMMYQTNAVGAAFKLSKLVLVGTIDPYTALNPNSG